MNTVRKHLSLIQGGRLAVASRAPVLALVISDVTGDDPTHIGSGPCTPDPTTFRDAVEILERFGVSSRRDRLPRTWPAALRGEEPETPKPGDPAFSRVENRVIATAHQSLMAAADHVRAMG